MSQSANPVPDIGPDDPRLSEWIDGRLPPAEAAEIARAVAGSPPLARLVADLRAIKAALGELAGSTRVADGFAARVAAATSHPSRAADVEPAVEEEWRRIEAERIAEERAEAVADVADEAPRPRRAWSLLAIAGSLAAGILVTVLANRPGEEMRDVARAPTGIAAPAPETLAAAPAARVADERKPGLSANAAGRSERDDAGAEIRAAVPRPGADRVVAAPAPAAATPAAGSTARGEADDEVAEMLDGLDAADVVEVEVLGPDGRAAFERLLASSGLEVIGGSWAARAGEAAGGAPLARRSADRSLGTVREQAPAAGLAEKSGPAAEMESGNDAAAGAAQPAEVAAEVAAGVATEETAGVATDVATAKQDQPAGQDADGRFGGGAAAGGQGQTAAGGAGEGVLVLQGSANAIDAFLSGIEPAGQRLRSGRSQLQQQRSRGQGPVQQQVVRVIELPAGSPPAERQGPAPADPAPPSVNGLPGAVPPTGEPPR